MPALKTHLKTAWAVGLVFVAAICVGCIQTTPDVVKIGLSAPFEGRYREVGYDVIPAVRLAVREWAAQNPDADLIFEVVAYDDGGDPQSAVEQARRLVMDPEVAAVIGHWRENTTAAALPTYAEAGLPVITFSMADLQHAPGIVNLSPAEADYREAVEEWGEAQGISTNLLIDCSVELTENVGQIGSAADSDQEAVIVGGPCWGFGQFYALAQGQAEGLHFVSGAAEVSDMAGGEWTAEQATSFAEGYEEGSLGAPPGMLAATAYKAAWLAISHLAGERGIDGVNSPVGDLAFDENGRLLNTPIYLYVWQDGQREPVTRLR
jgi:ABC-type branched-subunit amino acid transport system substrate-binding protein